jgi:type II secretory pathway pseudopilin PulG
MKKRGFTIIEVLVSLGLLMILVVGIFGIFPQSMIMGRISSKNTIASNLAQAKIEEILAKNYEDLPVGFLEGRHFLEAPFNDFEEETEISYVDENLQLANQDTGLKKIRVSVYFKEGQEKNVTLSTLMVKK